MFIIVESFGIHLHGVYLVNPNFDGLVFVLHKFSCLINRWYCWGYILLVIWNYYAYDLQSCICWLQCSIFHIIQMQCFLHTFCLMSPWHMWLTNTWLATDRSPSPSLYSTCCIMEQVLDLNKCCIVSHGTTYRFFIWRQLAINSPLRVMDTNFLS